MSSLRRQIEREIQDRGPIPFSRYMEICLYDPQQGYYSRNAEQFGKAGDFYTSSDLHAVFGRLLARQFEEIWQALDHPPQLEILELGPGRGLFARDVLDWSKKQFPDFFAALTYRLQESSPALRNKLEENLRGYVAIGKAEVDEFLEGRPIARSGPGEGTPQIIFANEFFDALPVEILSVRGKLEIEFVANHLREIWVEPRPEELEFLDRYSVHPEGSERIEVPFKAYKLVREMAAGISHGMIIAIDYGYTREQQLAGRHRGTLMTYHDHTASPDPYQAPGEQDITSHVNFTALAGACEASGMTRESLLTQAQFLMGIGQGNEFADVFNESLRPQEQAKRALQLKHLISPAGLGETFQVLIASSGIDLAKVRRLSGLSFASDPSR